MTLTLIAGLSFSAVQASWLDTLKTGAKIVTATAAVATATYYAGKFSGKILKNSAESRFADELNIIQNDSNVTELKKIIRANHVQRDRNNEYRNFPLVEEKAHLEWYISGLNVLRFLHSTDYKTKIETAIAGLNKIRTAVIGDSDFINERRSFESKK